MVSGLAVQGVYAGVLEDKMNNEEFRRYGHQAVDWIADYLENIREYPVLSAMQPGELVDRLPAEAPEQGESMDAILEDFERSVVPAADALESSSVPGVLRDFRPPPGILAEMLIATLNVNGMFWKSCPAVTELEQVTLGWLRQWMGLPEEFFGIIYDTASMRQHARDRRGARDGRSGGAHCAATTGASRCTLPSIRIPPSRRAP